MGLSEDADLIKGYNEWVVIQRTKDTTPEAYLLDRVKEEALATLLKAIDFLESEAAFYLEGQTAGFMELSAEQVTELAKILGVND